MGSTSGKKKKPNQLTDFVSWFEIPAINFEQAVGFYNHIYGIQMETTSSNQHTMAFFPSNGGIGGAVVSGPGSSPCDNGPLVYLNGGDDLNNVLSKVEEAGGRIIMTKTLISKEDGFFAIFIDSEGNKLALHSKN
jgi:predicted enzyme related to lactoylglutathione lyase